jgi:hypothetical protein
MGAPNQEEKAPSSAGQDEENVEVKEQPLRAQRHLSSKVQESVYKLVEAEKCRYNLRRVLYEQV